MKTAILTVVCLSDLASALDDCAADSAVLLQGHKQKITSRKHKQTTRDGPGEEHYIGCFTDNHARDMGTWLGSRTNAATNTFALCAAACDKEFMALQSGGECFCSDSYGNGDAYRQVDDSECNRNTAEYEPCASNAFNCGGHWRQAIYRRPTPILLSGATFVGTEIRELEVGQAASVTLREDPTFTAGVSCCFSPPEEYPAHRRGQRWTSELACGTPGNYWLAPPAAQGAPCSNHVTFEEARQTCSGFGARLCRSTEVAACRGAGGCNLYGEHGSDPANVWIEPPQSGATFVGTEIRELEVGQAASVTPREDPTFTAGVSCCFSPPEEYPDHRRGQRWTSELACGTPGNYWLAPPAAQGAQCSNHVTFEEARQTCSGFGARLCRSTEVAACHGAGGCNLYGEHGSDPANVWIEP